MRPHVPCGQGNEGPHLSLVVSFSCGYPEGEEGSCDVATLWGQVPVPGLLSLAWLLQCCGRLAPQPGLSGHHGGTHVLVVALP